MRGNSDRFFVKEVLGDDLLCIEDKDLIRQWKKVMRLKEGDMVRLFDGSGWEYKYQVLSIKFQGSSEAQLKLVDKNFYEEKKQKIYLGFGVLRDQARMEWMVEKCTELGVDKFIPLFTSNNQLIGKKELKRNYELRRKDRLKKKIIEACEQSGRVWVPEVTAVCSRDVLLEYLDWDVVVLNMEDRGRGFEVDECNKNTLLLVGPEGGWTKEELDFFDYRKYKYLVLNENILRAETAAMLGVGMVSNKQ